MQIEPCRETQSGMATHGLMVALRHSLCSFTLGSVPRPRARSLPRCFIEKTIKEKPRERVHLDLTSDASDLGRWLP